MEVVENLGDLLSCDDKHVLFNTNDLILRPNSIYNNENIKKLVFCGKRLKYIYSKNFSKLPHLRELHLILPNLECIASKVFNFLETLKVLNLNLLCTRINTSFICSTNIEMITLSAPRLKQVGSNFINNNKHLTFVKIVAPYLTRCGNNFLRNNKNLETLLYKSELKMVGTNFLYQCKSLKVDLQNFRKIKIFKERFCCETGLEIIDLENTECTRIQAGSFNNNKNLTLIKHLGKVKRIDYCVFAYNNGLKRVFLESPHVTLCGNILYECRNIEYVSVNFPKLTYLNAICNYNINSYVTLELGHLKSLIDIDVHFFVSPSVSLSLYGLRDLRAIASYIIKKAYYYHDDDSFIDYKDYVNELLITTLYNIFIYLGQSLFRHKNVDTDILILRNVFEILQPLNSTLGKFLLYLGSLLDLSLKEIKRYYFLGKRAQLLSTSNQNLPQLLMYINYNQNEEKRWYKRLRVYNHGGRSCRYYILLVRKLVNLPPDVLRYILSFLIGIDKTYYIGYTCFQRFIM